jgi:hypothetical protein
MKADLEARYLCEAGYERVSWHAPAGPEQVALEKWLKGFLAMIASCVAVIGVIAVLNNNFGPRALTDRMERIVAQLDRISTIRPETAHTIARVISQPGYDCEQVACDQNLKARNMAVRFRLETSLALKAGGVDVASSLQPAAGMASGQTE